MPKPKTIYIGIDPGAKGGLTQITPSGVTIQTMPQTERDIWDYIEDINWQRPNCKAYIEWIHPAIQGIGKSPMSKLYGNYMQLRMCLIAASIPFEDVKPRAWQAGLGISSRKKTENQTQWKDRLRAKAQELFPDLEIWKGKRNKGLQLSICDALLIAEYGRRKNEGKL